MQKFGVIKGGENFHDNKLESLDDLLAEYACDPEMDPRWMIYGKNQGGEPGIIHWIRPCDEDEMMANKIAKLLREAGEEAKVMAAEDYKIAVEN